MPNSFGEKLAKVFSSSGQLCIGIDPHSELLDSWGLTEDHRGLESFALSVIGASQGRVGIVKPQVAFFERFGSKGYSVLERVLNEAQAAGLLVIADAKRGDIGSTMAGYLEGWFGKTSSMPCDALTVSPFLGLDTVTELISPYLERGKGAFALVATSNPEAESIQSAQVDGKSVAEVLIRDIDLINQVTAKPGSFGSIGAVVGATLSRNRLQFLDGVSSSTPILAPGFGAQGARLEDIRRIFSDKANQVVATVSRSVLSDGPSLLEESIDRANQSLISGLRD